MILVLKVLLATLAVREFEDVEAILDALDKKAKMDKTDPMDLTAFQNKVHVDHWVQEAKPEKWDLMELPGAKDQLDHMVTQEKLAKLDKQELPVYLVYQEKLGPRDI